MHLTLKKARATGVVAVAEADRDFSREAFPPSFFVSMEQANKTNRRIEYFPIEEGVQI